MEDYKEHIATCFRLIAEKQSKGSIASWDTNDYKKLSELVKESSGTLLSVSTLKRISGKVNYSSRPNNTTLDALAQFLEYQDWRAFVSDQEAIQPRKEKVTNSGVWPKFITAFSLVAAAIIVAFFLFRNEKKIHYVSDDFSFESRPVSTGIPNSVVFDYDASSAEDNAAIEIQQDWDESKRIQITKSDSIATSIYYRPGFFKSKLVVDSIIVKESDVFITTNDWMGMIEQDPRPIYLDESDISDKGKISISAETLAAHNLDPRTSKVISSFYQVKDFGDLYTDDFEMSATVKNDFEGGVSACRAAQIFILYDGGAIGIPLAKKGCVSDLTLMTFDGFVDGKKNDLSGFGVDFSDFVELKCISKSNKLDVVLNGKSVYQMNVPDSPLKIKGITIHFEGAGSIKEVIFKKSEKIIYSDNFLN
ncbi:hypothetical protein LCGC14_0345580 [marine sediment metagenome]|uniref:Uncharacterized protein n=1 Tax=marine sediment metagenome TaxID=412755 RepID=A0A0F9TVF1_9ZZZZ|nr:hypothetical protein [Maribacter sp.]HDZ04689.1 hypothetical protein [Maribacter sp.]